ncbi:MAG: hypothetical protein LKE28_08800 [Sphaerochaeta sp.]|nr:hypothetical protein [Sphaerochaeta sp.]
MNGCGLEKDSSLRWTRAAGAPRKHWQAYGIDHSAYSNDEQMFALVHQMRTRIIKSPAFTSKHILGAILFREHDGPED